MKVIKSLFLIVLFLLQYSCVTDPDNNYTFFRINIDGITHPDTVAVNDTLTFLFDGYVGPNGCHRFSHFEVNKELNEIGITVWGTKPNFESICTTALVYLDGREYKTLLKKRGSHRIIVHQPDNSLLIDSVYIK